MKILVLNCGSSSLKFTLYDMPEGSSRVSGSVEQVGDKGNATWSTGSGCRDAVSQAENHHQAVEWVAENVFSDHATQVDGIGHRVVHGGETFPDAVLVDPSVEQEIAALSKLAPLHNPAQVAGIRAAKDAFPTCPQVAVFDTAFHQTLLPKAYRYALPQHLYCDHGIRRYGFHGTSHRFVSARAAELLDRPTFTGVTCHLGNGCSLASIQDGLSVDTTMGFTPLGGVPMGTRSGDLDPAVVLHIQRQLGYDPDRIDELLNRESGLLGLSGVSNDLRVIEEAAQEGHESVRLAVEVFAHQIAKAIGAGIAILDRPQGVVFTGGIGEHAVKMRGRILGMLPGLALRIDDARNDQAIGSEGIISEVESSMAVLIIPTQEELLIARDAFEVIQAFSGSCDNGEPSAE